MNLSEREYIILCRQLIEEKFHFGNENGTLRRRDFESLADSIEEKSGIKLGLSTLKSLWKKDFDLTPHPSTLQGLVSALGYKDWQEFKLKESLVSAPPPPALPSKKASTDFKRWMILTALIAVTILIWLIAFRHPGSGKGKPLIKGPVGFTGNKTESQGLPDTVIFNYDLSNVKADSFFFQQAWNNMEKVRIDPAGHNYSNIYYYPGFHQAKLIANDSIIKRFPIHITTVGWLPLVSYSMTNSIPAFTRKNRPIINGALHATREDLVLSKTDAGKNFVLSYYNVRDFENTSSDNFSLESRFACDSNNSPLCPGFQLMIMCEQNTFFVNMAGKGCETNTSIQMGEIFHDGVKNDLSVFGRDLSKWQRLKIQIIAKKATIYLEDQPVYTISFENDFGKIVGLVYSFNTTGAIDYVRLKNGENNLVYADEFNE